MLDRGSAFFEMECRNSPLFIAKALYSLENQTVSTPQNICEDYAAFLWCLQSLSASSSLALWMTSSRKDVPTVTFEQGFSNFLAEIGMLDIKNVEE